MYFSFVICRFINIFLQNFRYTCEFQQNASVTDSVYWVLIDKKYRFGGVMRIIWWVIGLRSVKKWTCVWPCGTVLF